MRLALAKKILFLSNGHGEDAIGAAIIENLLKMGDLSCLDIKAMPLVGRGNSYARLGIRVLGPCQEMPSGGFMRAGLSFLWKDLKAGWLRMLRKYVNTLKMEQDSTTLMVCVGDVFLLLLAGLFGKRPIIFLPTAKSDYIGGHYRIEKWLMRRLCKLVIARDERTASSLRSSGINAIYVGNAMMDCLRITGESFETEPGSPVIGILPGSRKEAYDNLMTILDGVAIIAEKLFPQKAHFLLCLASSLELKKMELVLLKKKDWAMKEAPAEKKRKGIIAYLVSEKGIIVKIVEDRFFGDVLNCSKVIIGTSGMANEQAVGLGKPVVAFSGKGAQITKRFLRVQRKLLGGAVFIVESNGSAVAEKVCFLLHHPEELRKVKKVGEERMGRGGAAEKIARLILSFPSSPLSS